MPSWSSPKTHVEGFLVSNLPNKETEKKIATKKPFTKMKGFLRSCSLLCFIGVATALQKLRRI